MDSSATQPTDSTSSGSSGGFLNRQLPHYPEQSKRYWYLGVTVITTIILYWVYFVPGAVTATMLPYYKMSFFYFLTLIVISNAVGAMTAFIGGLSDKIGRANLTIFGLLAVGLLQAFAVPAAHTKMSFAIAYVAIGFVEGIILVVTPALVRDFSPQLGRAAAMGFWALGPVLGSLVTSQVATHVLPHLPPWQDQFMISGFVCLVMFVLAFLALKELSPALRDQLMVSSNERTLIEARARGIDVEAAVSNPLRTMIKPDLLSSSVSISVFLLLYYATVTIFVLYWVIVYSKTIADANGINSWYFALDAAGLIIIGVISDKLKVRKPFMLAGGLGSIAAFLFFISKVHSPNTGYYALAIMVSVLGFTSAMAYAPWMANYTEAVEAKNPALVATGLSVWGFVLRIIVATAFLVIPHVISTANVLVDNQNTATTLQAFQAAAPYAPSTATLTCAPKPAPASVIAALNASGRPGPATLAKILAGCNQTHSLMTAIGQAGGLSNPQVTALTAYSPLALAIQQGQPVSDQQIYSKVGVHSPDLANLLTVEKKIIPAQKNSPNQWTHWWWVCLIGQAFFVLMTFTMPGRWSPAKAKADFEEYEAKIQAEMAKIGDAKE